MPKIVSVHGFGVVVTNATISTMVKITMVARH
jgi:hypothetical protein